MTSSLTSPKSHSHQSHSHRLSISHTSMHSHIYLWGISVYLALYAFIATWGNLFSATQHKKIVPVSIRTYPITSQQHISVTPSVWLAPQINLITRNHTYPVWTSLLFHSCCNTGEAIDSVLSICDGDRKKSSHDITAWNLKTLNHQWDLFFFFLFCFCKWLYRCGIFIIHDYFQVVSQGKLMPNSIHNK